MGAKTLSLLLALAAASTSASAASVQPRDSSDCDEYHIFLARGNNEPYPGRQGQLVEGICDGMSSCGYENLIYSALYTDEYCQTTYDGSVAGHVQLAAYANRCPDSKLILGGYSQGAQIITDILGGGGGTLFNGCVQPSTPALSRSTAPGSRIVAAIVFGDVRHTADQSYNYGNGSAINGLFPRTSTMLSAIDDYASVLRDWCSDTDSICAANQKVSYMWSHLGYYAAFSSQAAAWVKEVAGMKDDSDFTTVIPTYVSGTVQDYATIGTATPSGTVVLDTTWTLHTSVTATAEAVLTAVSTTGSTAVSMVETTTSRSASTKATGATSSAAATTTSARGGGSGVGFNSTTTKTTASASASSSSVVTSGSNVVTLTDKFVVLTLTLLSLHLIL